ncbi:transcriptional regulator [Kineosporia sp. NBRC 101731]|nr:transcriptional regulator [Kineosporia sp. NBRC 101731]
MLKRTLGRSLATARIAAKMTMTDVTNTRVFGSRQKLWRIETGQGPYRWSEVQALADIYRVDLGTRSQWVDWAMKAEDSGWWEDFSSAVWDQKFGLYLELERAASTIMVCNEELIHGLLQTDSYHRSILAVNPPPDSEAAEQLLKLRVERQAATLERSQPVHLKLILSEASLNHQLGGPAVLAEQINRLIELDERPNISVRYLPFALGGHPSMRGAYTLLQFDDDDLPAVAYVAALDGGRFVEEKATVQRFMQNARLLSGMAVPIKEHRR